MWNARHQNDAGSWPLSALTLAGCDCGGTPVDDAGLPDSALRYDAGRTDTRILDIVTVDTAAGTDSASGVDSAGGVDSAAGDDAAGTDAAGGQDGGGGGTSIADLRALATGTTTVDLDLDGVYVAYARQNSYTVQAVREGPAVLVFVSPTTHGVTVGDRIRLHVTELDSYHGMAEITAAEVVSNDHGDYDVRTNLRQALASGAGTAPAEELEAELVGVQGATVTGGSGNVWQIQYGSAPVTANLYAFASSTLGLCVGATIDVLSGYVSQYDANYDIRTYAATDITVVSTAGCGGATDAGPGDTSAPDASSPDSSTPDSSTPDSALSDSATPDTATPDTATPDTATAPDTAVVDAGPTCTSIAALRAMADGPVDVDLCPAYVTYVRFIGFFLQELREGPAIYVYTDDILPGDASIGVTVGNRVTVHATRLATYQGQKQIEWNGTTSVLSNDGQTYNVTANLAQELSAGAGVAPGAEMESELVVLDNATVVSGSDRDYVITYGTAPVTANLYLYEGGLCPGATFDLVAGYVGASPTDYNIRAYYAADLANVDDSGCTPPAVLRINEVNPNLTNGCDLVELRVISGGSLEGLYLKVRTTKVITFPEMVVAKNGYVVVHFGTAANCNASGAIDETTAVNAQAAATHPQNFDTAYDLYTGANNGMTQNTESTLSLYNAAGEFVDAVFLTSDFARTDDTAVATNTQAELVRAAGEWLKADGSAAAANEFINAVFHANAVVDTNACGVDATGVTMQRLNNQDTNKAGDWTSANANATWGQNNAGQTNIP